MANVGYATLTVIPSVRGIQGEISKQMAGEMQSAGRKGGAALSSSMGRAVKRATGLGAAIASGLAIKGGMSRLLQIDQAEAKLRGLGLTAKEIQRVSGNVDTAVTGTAFSLSEGMSAATTAMSSGVKQGAELERYLKLIGDVATQGGASYQEMASIINQVQARGKVGQENLNRLTERGIGIQSMLADYYGVSGEELQTMLRKGMISAGDFQKVLEKNFAGSAQEAGNTVTGSFANMRTSFSRMGAVLLKPVFQKLPQLFTSITSSVKNFAKEGGVAERVGGAIGRAFAGTVEVLGTVVGWMKEHKTTTVALAAAVGSLVVVTKAHAAVLAVQAAGGLVAYIKNLRVVAAMTRTWAAVTWLLNAALLSNPIGLIVVGLAALGAGLVLAYKKSDTFRAIVDKAWAGIKVAIAAAWAVIRPVFAAVASWVGVMLPKAFAVFKTLAGVAFKIIGTQVRVWWSVLKAVFAAVKWYVQTVLGPVFSWLWSKVISPVFGWIGRRISAVWNNVVKPSFAAFRTGVSRVASAFSAARDGIRNAWGKLGDVVSGPINAAKRAISGFIDLINKIPGVKIPNPFKNTKPGRGKGGSSLLAGGGRQTGFASGGWTGPGSKFTPAGVVHADEFVISKRARQAFESRNPGVLDFINRTGQMPLHGAYASGGRVVPGGGNRHTSGYPWATYAGDFPNPIGTPVNAWKDGTIAMVKSLTTSYGKHIRMNHTDGTSSLYAHLSSFAKSVGDKVKQGTMIGRVGSTGNSTGPHLHFETMGGPYKGGPGGGGSIWDSLKGATGKIGGWIKSKLTDKANIGGLFGNVSGLFSRIGEGVKSHVTSKLFDTGGLAGGKGLMVKNTLSPERVLSPRQTAAFESALSRGFGPAGGGGSRFHVVSADISGAMDEIQLVIEESIDNAAEDDDRQFRRVRAGA